MCHSYAVNYYHLLTLAIPVAILLFHYTCVGDILYTLNQPTHVKHEIFLQEYFPSFLPIHNCLYHLHLSHLIHLPPPSIIFFFSSYFSNNCPLSFFSFSIIVIPTYIYSPFIHPKFTESKPGEDCSVSEMCGDGLHCGPDSTCIPSE